MDGDVVVDGVCWKCGKPVGVEVCDYGVGVDGDDGVVHGDNEVLVFVEVC